MTLSASVGGLVVLAVAAFVVIIVFGRSAMKNLLRVAAVIFLIYLAAIWSPVWLPWVAPAWETVQSAWARATAGPRG